MVDAIQSQKTKIEASTDGGTTFIQVKGLTGIGGLDGEASDIDVSTLDSDAKEFITGLADAGNMNLSGYWLNADPGQEALRTAKSARTQLDFKVTFSDGFIAEFKGNVKVASFDSSLDAAVAGTFGIKISGEAVFTPAP